MMPVRAPVQATTSILGVVMGPIRLEHKGTVTVRGCQSGYAAKFKLHATGMLTSKSKMHEASPPLVSLVQMALCRALCTAHYRARQSTSCCMQSPRSIHCSETPCSPPSCRGPCQGAVHTYCAHVQPAQVVRDSFGIDAQVSGTVEKDGAPMKGLKLKGKWDTELVAEMPDGSSRRLWTMNPPAADPTRCCTHASALCLSI